MAKVCRYEQDALNQLPPELRESVRKVWQETLDEKKYVLQHKYNLGLLVQKAREFTNEHPRQKRKIFAMIREILHIKHQRPLDRAERLVTLFSLKEMERLTKVNESGFCLSWSHFEYIMLDYLTKEQMVSYLTYARKYSIPPREMYEIAKTEHGGKRDVDRKKAPISAKAFTKTVTDYLTNCAVKDTQLLNIPDNVLAAWKSEINKNTLKKLIRELEEHVVKCNKLKEKLCK